MGSNQQNRKINSEYFKSPLNTFIVSKGDFFMKKTIIKFAFSIILPIIIFFLIIAFFSLLITNTSMPEKYESIVTIVSSAITTIIMSFLLTKLINIKPIYCSLITFLIMFIFKLLINLAMNTPISFGRQGIIGIIFLIVFSILGSILGLNFKK